MATLYKKLEQTKDKLIAETDVKTSRLLSDLISSYATSILQLTKLEKELNNASC